MSRQFTVAIAGTGSRGGGTYAPYQKKFPDRMKIVALADPDTARVSLLAKEYGVPAERCFSSAEALLEQPKLADVLVLATQDRQHVAQAVPALRKGYDILLEKPISNDPYAIMELLRTAQETGRAVTVCHVLRYTPFYSHIKRLITEGAIGEPVAIHAAENVGYWHQAHSFVRGNWANSQVQSPMILQKSCHDMDMILWLMGKNCTRVSSYGSLSVFRPDQAPEGAAETCLGGCQCKETCPYDAEKVYITGPQGVASGQTEWPVDVVIPEPTVERVREALKTSPYGRCVYHCGNDVVDHQAVVMEFEDGSTATFTMSAFTTRLAREIKVMGTKGEIIGDMNTNLVTVYPFSGEAVTYNITELAEDFSGHGGGDHRMMSEFFDMMEGKSKGTLTSLDISVQSHLMSLAAEESRLNRGAGVAIRELAERYGSPK
ncbi:MAG: Gfo/Idh/MocA family oxidoreductase [Clostridiales bacterium]|nr:Gfo/Idh/MocA family oxidoreductase [Clostridiales bacterium]